MGDIADLYDYVLWPEDFAEDRAGEAFETSCRNCRRTILMVPTAEGWRPFDKHGEERHRCAEARRSDFPPV
jgi:hypothetical protein